jgi:hypothetical protein
MILYIIDAVRDVLMAKKTHAQASMSHWATSAAM